MSSYTVDYLRLEEERKKKLQAEAQARIAAITEYIQYREEGCRNVHYACQSLIREIYAIAHAHPALKDICQTCAHSIGQEEADIVSSFQNISLSMRDDESHDAFMRNIRAHNTYIYEYSSSQAIQNRVRKQLGNSLCYVDAFLSRIESIHASAQNDSIAISREATEKLGSSETKKRYTYLKKTAASFLEGDLVAERRRLLQDLCDKSDREWISGTSDDLQDILDALSSQISAALEDASVYRQIQAYALHNGDSVKPLCQYQTRDLLSKALSDIRKEALDRAEEQYIRRSVETALCELGYKNSTIYSLNSNTRCSTHTASSAANVGLRVMQNSDTLFIEPVRIDTSSARTGRENTAQVRNIPMSTAVADAQKDYCDKHSALIRALKKRGIIVDNTSIRSAGERYGELKVLTIENGRTNAKDTQKEEEVHELEMRNLRQQPR